MPKLAVIEAPFYMGSEGVEVGGGPKRLVEARAATILGNAPVTSIRIAAAGDVLAAVAAVNRVIAASVRQSISSGSVPVVLAGDCNSCLGTLAGMGGRRLGIVWLDAHGDFHTPETSHSGFLDGMVLAAAVGHCHGELANRIGHRTPVPEENTVLLGVRDLEPEEATRLEQSPVNWRTSSSLYDVPALLSELAGRVDSVYVHVDADVLNPEESPGVNFLAPGGISVRDGEKLVEEIVRAVPLGAVAFTNYNPERDPDGRTCEALLGLMRALGRGVES